MKFMNDWIGFALMLALLCGGLVAGRRLGVVAAWWLAGGAWLAFRFADRLWKPTVIELRTAAPGLELASTIPLAYALLFVALLIPTGVWIALIRPGPDYPLPARAQTALSYLGGLLAGCVLFLALAQAHIMHPTLRERMPRTLGLAEALLRGAGQKYVAPATTTPAAEGNPK